MRTILRIFAIVVFVSPFIGNAQQKETEFICKKVDPFDDSVSYTGISTIVYTDGGDMKTEGVILHLYPIASKRGFELSIIFKAAGMDTCTDEGSILNIIFENGEKLEMVNWNDFDCDGTNYFRMPTKTNELNLLATQPIKAMRYRNIRDYQTYTMLENMTAEASNAFINIMKEINGLNAGTLTIPVCKAD